jgi:ParB family chromosome partitioning protein
MKDQQTPDITIEHVPLTDCVLSDLNPRQEVAEDGIAQLAENIRSMGLIHNLAGLRQADGTVAIVAGGRRLRALQMLGDDPRFRSVPVQIAPDEATARQWAASENHLREPLHPADEIANFRALSESGATVPEIALAFGVGERQVYRRLALAGLPQPVLDALRADDITLAMAACFTLANDETRALEVLAQVRGQAVSERQIKTLLQPEAVASTDRRARFVGKDAYVAAGGSITTDLFAEADYWTDTDLLDRLFLERLTKEAETVGAVDGWLWSDIETAPYLGWYEIEARNCARLYAEPGTLTDGEAEQLEALSTMAETDHLSEADARSLDELEAKAEGAYSDLQKAHAGFIAYVDHDGALRICAGLVRPEDRKEALAAGVLSPSQHDREMTRARPMISAALARDLNAVERGARQSALLEHPDLLLDLLAFQLSGKAGYARAMAIRTDHVEIGPSTETGYDPDPRLVSALGSEALDPVEVATAFKRFRKQSKAKRREALSRALAALVDPVGDGLADLIDEMIKLDVRSYWTPTAENTFGRVTSGYLDTLWQEFLGVSEDHPSVTTFKRLKKREKADRLAAMIGSREVQDAQGLSEAQRAVLAGWRPDPNA